MYEPKIEYAQPIDTSTDDTKTKNTNQESKEKIIHPPPPPIPTNVNSQLAPKLTTDIAPSNSSLSVQPSVSSNAQLVIETPTESSHTNVRRSLLSLVTLDFEYSIQSFIF